MPRLESDGENVMHEIEVVQENILLGVTGGIFKNTVDTLKTLGIRGQSLNELLIELHFTAVDGIEQMWRHRQAIIAKKTGLGLRRSNRPSVRHKKRKTIIANMTGPGPTRPSIPSTRNKKRKYSQHEPSHRKQKCTKRLR